MKFGVVVFAHLGAPAVAGSDPEIFDFAGTPHCLRARQSR
jgi:hypothetical protein